MLKKIWLLLLVTALLLSVSACGKTPVEQPPEEKLVTDPITLIDEDTLVVRVLKIEPDNQAGYTISTMVWNRTDIEFNFIFDDFAVNDLLYGEDFQFIVEPEQKKLLRITLTPQKMELLGLSKVTKVSFRFYGMQTDITYDGIFFEEELEFFPLGEAAYQTHQRTPSKTDKFILDNEFCTVTFVKSYMGDVDQSVSLYVVNKTDKELLLIANDTTINGKASNLSLRFNIKAGKKSYENILISNTIAMETFAANVSIYDALKYSDGPLVTVPVSVK